MLRRWPAYFDSIRVRIFSFNLLLVLILFGAMTVSMYLLLRRNLEKSYEDQSREKMAALRAILQESEIDLHQIVDRVELEWSGRGHHGLGILVQRRRGHDSQILALTPGFEPKDFLREEACCYYKSTEVHRDDALYEVVFALDQADQIEIFYLFSKGALALLILTLLLFLYFSDVIVRKETAPIRNFARRIRKTSSESLGDAIDPLDFPIDLRPLIGSFNSFSRDLKGAFDRLNQFSSDLAHELRNPINALLIKLSVTLKQPRSQAEYREVLYQLLDDTEGLTKLIDTLLFLARTEHPRAQLDFQDTDLSREITPILEFYEALAGEKSISVELVQAGHFVVPVDRYLFRRSIGNLIHNAIKFSPENSKVQIRVHGDDKKTIVSVEDQGIGISPDQCERIFDRLYRVDNARNPQSGLGLGLSIVRSIQRLHGGSVQVTSRLGGGSRFDLIFSKHQTV